MYKQVQHILHGHPSPQSIILPTPATLPVMDRICALASGQIATSLGVSSDSDERRLLCSAVGHSKARDKLLWEDEADMRR